MAQNPSPLLSAARLGAVTLKNRLAVAPMTRVSGLAGGLVSAEMTAYYARFAKGGFGMVITEGIYTDDDYSQCYRFQPGLTNAAQAQSFRPLTAALKAHGTMAIAQIMHGGALAQGNDKGTIAPSAITPKGSQLEFYFGKGAYPTPLEITPAQIATVIGGFATAAELAVSQAGFDGIEIHGANGYLLDQFLTSHTNQRGDDYGGGVQNRLRLACEIIAAVRLRIGQDVPLGIRISQGKVNDFTHKWEGGEADAAVIFSTLQDAGVDFIHVTEYAAWAPAFGDGASLAALARRYAPNVVIIANGGLEDAGRAQEVLEAGADVIALGKGALANPDYPIKLAQGQEPCAFDPQILGPVANIKASELAL